MPIIDTTLPVHPSTGLRAIGVLPSGRPVWPVLGASDDNDDQDGTDTPGEDADAEQLLADAVEKDGEGDGDQDGDVQGDEKNWEAEFEAQKKVNRNLERRGKKDLSRIKQLEAELAELRDGKNGASREGTQQEEKDGKPADKTDAPDPEEIRRRIESELKAEAAKERVLDKIEVKARGFADPADAVALVLKKHTVDDFLDEGKPDLEAIEDALKDLLEEKPYLAAQGGKRFKGSGDGGPKAPRPQRPRSLNEAVNKRLTPNT